jgi:hypothetical protein
MVLDVCLDLGSAAKEAVVYWSNKLHFSVKQNIYGWAAANITLQSPFNTISSTELAPRDAVEMFSGHASRSRRTVTFAHSSEGFSDHDENTCMGVSLFSNLKSNS